MTNKYTLFGDGINDDTLAIQELLDSKMSVVELPVPKVNYSISKTLIIHSNQTLKLGATTVIKLLPNSSCIMITNEENAHDVVISGGIWDYNNTYQAPNPLKTGEWYNGKNLTHGDGNPQTIIEYNDSYLGVPMRFLGVQRFTLSDLTVKNPVTFCVQIANAKYFTIENIRFDQNFGNPTPENMDGIHLDGGCKYGMIKNIQGTCYDDVIALNANDFHDGPIEDIVIDGVYANDSLRGVRLLSTKSPVRNISISNVFGTFYQNCIGITYFYKRSGVRGIMSNISIKNIFAENAPRIPEYNKSGPYTFSLVWIDGDLDIDSVSIDNLHRNEKVAEIETIKVCKNANIKNLSVSNSSHQNNTGKKITFMKNEGKIENLYLYNINTNGDILLENNGEIKNLKEL